MGRKGIIALPYHLKDMKYEEGRSERKK